MTTPRKDGGPRVPRKSTIKRWQCIEGFYLNGFKADAIAIMLPKQHRVTHGTVKNDIVSIRKRWACAGNNLDALEGKHRYLASLREVRTKAIETGELNLVHKIDKELAKLSGVRFMSDEQVVHMEITEAKQFVEKVMEIVMSRVPDQEVRQAIINDIEKLSNE